MRLLPALLFLSAVFTAITQPSDEDIKLILRRELDGRYKFLSTEIQKMTAKVEQIVAQLIERFQVQFISQEYTFEFKDVWDGGNGPLTLDKISISAERVAFRNESRRLLTALLNCSAFIDQIISHMEHTAHSTVDAEMTSQ